MKWLVGKSLCRVCSHSSIEVFPDTCDPDALECGNCHAMAAEIVAYLCGEELVPVENL